MLKALKNNLHTAGISADDVLLVGVSGGRDSVALLCALQELKEMYGYRLIAAHFNHGIRGAEADGDEAFVKELAERLGVEYLCAKADVPAVAAAENGNLEDVARRLRYDWLNEQADRLEAETSGKRVLILTAHHLEDQAETVLLHLLRGSGIEGLSGMRPLFGRLFRPFLNISRTELEEYLHNIGQNWREDSTNTDTELTRNRLRHELWPQLLTYNGNLAAVLGSTADICAEEADFVALSARRAMGVCAAKTPLGYVIELPQFLTLHLALRRRIVRMCWRLCAVIGGASGTVELPSRHTEDILALSEGKQLSLPCRIYAARCKGRLYIGHISDDEKLMPLGFNIKPNPRNN